MDEKDKVEHPSGKKENKFISYIYYILIGVISFILLNLNHTVDILLGDSGQITKVLLLVVAITSLKWLPLLCIVGVILQYNKERLKDITSTYMFVVGFVFVTSIILLIITK